MRINNLFVEKYGKFNQREIEFKDRVNLIYGKNEAGKSTLYNLIIALLYGFYPANRNDYPYVSWNDDRIEFEATINAGENVSHVKRILNSKASLEIRTGHEYKKMNNHVLEHVNHVSKNIYENVYSITSESLNMILGKTWSEIQDKLLFNMGSELLTSPLKIMTHLEKQSGELWKNNKRGNQQIRQIDQELRTLKQKRNEAMKAYDKLYELETKEKVKRIKADELTKELLEMDSNIQELKAWIPLNNLIQRQANLKHKIISLDSLSIELKQDYDVHLRTMGNEIEVLDGELNSVENEILILKQRFIPLLEKEKQLLAYEQEMYQLTQWGQSLDFLDTKANEYVTELLEVNNKLSYIGEQLFNHEHDYDYIGLFSSSSLNDLIGPLLELKDFVRQIEDAKKAPIQVDHLRINVKRVLFITTLSIISLGVGIQFNTELLKNAGLVGLGFALASSILKHVNANKSEILQNNKINECQLSIDRVIKKIQDDFPNIEFKESLLKRMDDIQIKKIENYFENVEKVKLLLQKSEKTKEKREDLIKNIESLSIVSGYSIKDYKTFIVQLQTRLDKIREQDKQNSIINTDLTHLNGKLEELQSKFNKNTHALDSTKSELIKLGEGHLNHGIQKINEHINATVQLREVEEEIQKYTNVKYLGNKLDQSSLIKIENKRQIIHNQLSEHKIQLAEINKDITYIKEDVKIEMILSDIASKEDQRQSLAIKRDKLILMAEVIKVAEEQFRLKNQPDVLKRASQYLNHMTQGKYSQLYVNNDESDPRLHVLKAGSKIPMHVTSSFSKGTHQQIYLSLRLALLDHLDSGKNQLPLVLDETFSNWDDDRLEPTLKIIDEIATHRQVFLFTCQNDIASRIEEVIDVQRLVL